MITLSTFNFASDYRCSTAGDNNSALLLNSNGIRQTSFDNNFRGTGLEKCQKYLEANVNGSYRCSTAGDNNSALLLNANGIQQTSFDDNFQGTGLEKCQSYIQENI